jgi:hypothetical protein
VAETGTLVADEYLDSVFSTLAGSRTDFAVTVGEVTFGGQREDRFEAAHSRAQCVDFRIGPGSLPRRMVDTMGLRGRHHQHRSPQLTTSKVLAGALPGKETPPPRDDGVNR